MRRMLRKNSPIIALICVVALVSVTAVHGVTFETAELLGFAGILLYASLTDLKERRIPNACIIAALAVRAAYLMLAFAFGWLNMRAIGYYVFSACAIGLALVAMVLVADRVFGRESMGGGDLKLFFAAGFYFGWQQGLVVVLLSCVFGIVAGLVGKFEGGGAPGEEDEFLKRTLPFGPFIAAACFIVMLIGNAFSL